MGKSSLRFVVFNGSVAIPNGCVPLVLRSYDRGPKPATKNRKNKFKAGFHNPYQSRAAVPVFCSGKRPFHPSSIGHNSSTFDWGNYTSNSCVSFGFLTCAKEPKTLVTAKGSFEFKGEGVASCEADSSVSPGIQTIIYICRPENNLLSKGHMRIPSSYSLPFVPDLGISILQQRGADCEQLAR